MSTFFLQKLHLQGLLGAASPAALDVGGRGEGPSFVPSPAAGGMCQGTIELRWEKCSTVRIKCSH